MKRPIKSKPIKAKKSPLRTVALSAAELQLAVGGEGLPKEMKLK